MLDIGAEALAMLNRSHGVTGRLTASVNRSQFTYPVNFEKATIQVSGSSQIRRKLKATIQANINDPEVDVFRTELFAEYGIYTDPANIIWIPQGVFVVTDAVEVQENVVEISCSDRWHWVQNARFLQPIATAGLHTEVIRELLRDTDSRIPTSLRATRTSRHNSKVWERDRDKAIIELAAAASVEVFFNQTGTAVIQEPKGLTAAADWVIGAGDGGALIESSRGRDQGNSYNAVSVAGETTEGVPPVRAQAFVTNPQSPLLYGGPFGKRPRFYTSSMITNQQQAQMAADTMLAKVSGISKTLDLSTFPHPGLDTGDIIRAEVRSGEWETHMVDGFSLPLGPGSISISTRSPYSADAEESES